MVVTNKDIWAKLEKLERKVDRLSIKVYAFATATIIIAGFIGVVGGVRVG